MLLLWPPFVHPASLLVVTVGAGVGHAFFVPAAQALVPALVPAEHLQHANGLRAAGSQVANLAGNAVGGALYTLLGAPVLLVLNGFSFLLSAAQERRIRSVDPVSTPGGTGQSVAAAAREGLRLLRREKPLRLLITSQAGLFLVSPVLMLSLPFVVIDELGHPPAVVGFMFSLALAGGIVAFALLRLLPVDRMLRLPLVPGAYAAITAAFALLSTTTTTVALATAALLFGLSSGTVYLTAVTWIQRRIPASLHGRIFALLEAVSSLVAPVSYLVTGIVLEGLGTSGRWIAFASLAGAGGIWTLVTAVAAPRRRDSGSSNPPPAPGGHQA
jgi:MFS family permease